MTSIVALIPARAGSKRIPGKNTKLLAGHPLLAYTIAAAKQSGVFDRVMVCTDSVWIRQVAQLCGADPYARDGSSDDEPDIRWVQGWLRDCGDGVDAFAILRPTSPFRSAESIKGAVDRLLCATDEDGVPWADSVRAIAPVTQHPGKMWTTGEWLLNPLLLQPTGQPWHSSPTQTLPAVYTQTAGLEVAWTDTVRETGTIAGDRILGYHLPWPESLDINTLEDWWLAEHLVETGQAKLPEVT